MARGNFVDRVEVKKKSDRIEIVSKQSFKYYKELKVSKAGTLIGYWDKYRDYITTRLPKGSRIIKREEFKITIHFTKT